MNSLLPLYLLTFTIMIFLYISRHVCVFLSAVMKQNEKRETNGE